MAVGTRDTARDDGARGFSVVAAHGDLAAGLDERTRAILDHRRATTGTRRRDWLVRRLLVLSDVVALMVAFAVALVLFPPGDDRSDHVNLAVELLVFGATIPCWIVCARLCGLYGHDEERVSHSTADDLFGVIYLVTIGTWVFFLITSLTGLATPSIPKLATFWAIAVVLVPLCRTGARAFCRRRLSYLQNTIVVGAGEIGQLIARKLLQHPEYGINLVGFVDEHPREYRGDLGDLALLGTPAELPAIVRQLQIDRVIIAFSRDTHVETLALVRALDELGLQVDIVPRLFEVIGPRVDMHALEGIPLLGRPPIRMTRSSRIAKRAFDILGAMLLLILTSPLFVLVSVLIKRDSPGPAFLRQTRLGKGMREIEVLKFRTMKIDTDDSAHRAYIAETMKASAPVGGNGLYKLDQDDAVTRVGRALRKTSVDELPQLWNVLRGEMSLVGPRPCLAYEIEHFAPHHFDRFLVPAGLTGLWQVSARACSTFGEALDLDVLYAHSWSLGLDLRLIARTPAQVLKTRGTA